LEKAPIIEETSHHREVEVVQPVVHREREQQEVHQVVENIFEREVRPTTLMERELPAVYKADVVKAKIDEAKLYSVTDLKPAVIVAPVETERVVKEPIVIETLKKKVIEVVQPVIHRETFETNVTYSTQPIFEKVIEEPVVVREVVNVDRTAGVVIPDLKELKLADQSKVVQAIGSEPFLINAP